MTDFITCFKVYKLLIILGLFVSVDLCVYELALL